MPGAVAVDLGAGSARYAAGRLVDGRIEFEIVEQIPHAPRDRNGRLEWDIETLLSLCRRAADYAANRFESAALGIDSWGVDHGFLREDGILAQPPVCYRDPSHAAAFEALKEHRPRLYALTGIQHQPFNTLYQLLARRREDPDLTRCRWMILPDLLGYLLAGEEHHELTQASTTNLLGLDDRWSEEAFALAGWPVPDLPPTRSGTLGPEFAPGVRLAHVGSHDTASAVAGFGRLEETEAFLNVGTWSLVGCLLDHPLATPEAEAANFTNERAADGRVRFLCNVPGFYVINRLHEELRIADPVPAWLSRAQAVDERLDLFHEDLFSPPSMRDACLAIIPREPTSPEEWAGLALGSLAETIAAQPAKITRLTGRAFTALRVGGGGSQSEALCQALADASGLEVRAGPAEATVLGNMAVALLASGAISSAEEMQEITRRSAEVRLYRPR